MKKQLSFLMLLAALIVPQVANAQTRLVSVGNWSATTSSAYGGFHNTSKYSWTQTLYLQSEMGAAGWIQAIILDNRSTVANLLDSAKIYLGHSTMTTHPTAAVSTWVPQSDLTLVWSRSNYTIPGEVGQLVIELDQPFYYNGTGSLAFVVSKATQTTSTNTKFGYVSTTASMKYTGGATDSYCRFPTVAGTNSTYKQNIKFVMTDNETDSYSLPVTGLHRVENMLTSSTVAWNSTPGASYEAGFAEVGGTDNSTTIIPVSVSDTSYTATGLSANTEYWIYVRKVQNSAYSAWDSIKIRTLMTPLTLPLSFNFENEDDDADWAINNAANGWYINSLGQRRCMFVSNDNGLHNNYTITTSGYSWAWVDVNLSSGAYGISFDWRAQGESTWDYLRVFLVPSSVYLDENYATWGASNTFSTSLPSGWLSLSTSPGGLHKLNLDSTWSRFSGEVYLPDSMAGNYHLAILWANDASTGTQPPAAIDNISFDVATCFAPTACTVTNITPNEATLSITHDNATNFMYVYAKSGATRYDTVTFAGTSHTLTGLQMGATYTGLVYTLCGDDTSAGATTFTFTTTCGTLTSADLPYAEDFEGYASGSSNPINSCWHKGTSSSTAYPYPYSTAAINGSRGLYFYGYHPSSATGTFTYSWAALPPIDEGLNMSDLMVTFNAKRYSSTGNTYKSYIVVGIADSVTTLTTASIIDSSVTWIDTIDLTSSPASTVAAQEVSFENYLGSGKYVFFYAPCPDLVGTSTTCYNHIYLDDITLRAIPNCFWPSSMALESVGTESAEISWVPDPRTSNPNEWIVEYGPHGFLPGEGESTTTGDTIIELTDLLPNTEYDIYVIADCGNDYSDAAMLTFRTRCVALDSLPYTQTFESEATTTSTSTTFIPCWGHLNNGTQYFGYPYLSSSSTYNHTANGSKGLYWYGATTTGTYGDYQIVVLPSVNTEQYPINTLQLRFWAKSSSTSYDVRFQVGVMTDPTDANSFQLVDNVIVGGNTTWTEYTVALGTFTGEGQYIAIKAMRPSSTWYAYMDDITMEVMPACPPVSGIEAVTTVGSALLNWSWQAGYEAPDAYVVTYDSIGGTNPTTVNPTTNSTVLTGLQPNSEYKAYVMVDCGSDGYGQMDSVSFTTAEFGCLGLSLTEFSNSTTGVSGCLAYSSYGNTVYQTIYTASELLAAGVTPGIISAIDLGFTSSTYAKEFSIYLGTTTTSSISNSTIESLANHTRVYGPASHPAGTEGWQHYVFDTVFVWDGISNIIMTTFMNQPAGTSQTLSTGLTGYYVSAANKARFRYRDSQQWTTGNLTEGTGSSTYSYRAAIHFYVGQCTGIATCANPVVVVTESTPYAVDLAWAPGYNETSWNIDYRAASDSVWTNAATGVTVTNYTVSGLQPATDYIFRVSFTCADNEFFSGTVAATTQCAPIPLPYTENFDALTTGTATSSLTVRPNCWDFVLTGSSTYQAASYYPGVYYNATYAHSGSYSYRLYGVGYYMLPEVSASIDSLMISFYDYTTSVAYGLIVGVVENGFFVPIDTVQNLVANEHNYIEMPLSNYHGTSHTLALCNYNTTSSTYYAYHYIDDIRVELIPDCVRPITVEVTSLSDTSATIVWDSLAAGYEVYFSTMSVNPDSIAGAVFTPVTSNTITLTGLSSNTQYYFYVRTNCGIVGYSDWSNEFVFRTACAPLPLPYTEDFESYATGAANPISPCWVKGTNNTTAYPYPYATNAVTGQRSLYFYAYHPSSATSVHYYSYAALPMFQDSTNRLMLSFKVRRYATVSNTYTTRLVIGVMDNPNDIATFFPMDTLDLQAEAASSVHGYEYYFNNYAGTGRYLAIYDEVPPLYGTGTSCYSYAYVDDILVDTIPSCARPSNITVSGIGQYEASVHWNAGENAGSFEIEYGPRGFTPGMGQVVTSAVDSVTLNGLNPSTLYDVYVRAICSATNQSNWSFVQSFATLCGPTALPMVYDPDDYSTGSTAPLPTCWTRTNNATGTTNYYPYIYSSSANAHSGNNTVYYYFSTSSGYATDELIAFPEVDVLNYPMNTVEISFWAKASVAGKHFQVGVMTNPSDVSTFQTIDSIALNTTVSEYTVNFSNYTGNGAHIALRGEMEGTSSYYIYVDDIYIGVMSHCPRSYNLTAYDGTATGATLAWTDTIGSTNWMVEYRIQGDTASVIVPAGSNPFTLTGLTANTVYSYRVAPICADGIQADWSRESFSFATSQVPATVPYSYNFENGTEWENWQTLSNNTVNWYRGTAAHSDSTYAMYLSTNNGATQSWNLTFTTNAAVYRDFDFGTTPQSYELTFDALVGGSTDGNYDGITVMVVDPAIIPEASSTGLTSPWGHISSVDVRMDTLWSGESIYLDGMQGVKRIVFFHFNQATASSHPYIDIAPAIDNIAIGVQPCIRPYNLAADNITDQSALLSWAGPATDTYVVCHRVYGTSSSTSVYDTVTSNSFLLTGLNANEEYSVWVLHVCSLTATDTLVSAWSDRHRFTTECGLYTLPYLETFDLVPAVAYNAAAGQLPACWRAYSNGTNDIYIPHVVGSGSYWYSVGSTPALTMTSGSATYGDTKIVALPPFDAPVSACGIQFSYRHESTSYGTLEIGYVTSDDLAGTFQPLVALPATTTMTLIDSTLLSNAPATATRIALRWTHNASFYSVGIDNISVWLAGTVCPQPVVTSVDTTYNSVTLHWVGSETVEAKIMEGLWDATAGTAQTATTGTVTFSGLTPAFNYTAGIRTVCEDGLYSDWVVIPVTTADLPCFAPTGVAVTNVTSNGGTITWTEINNATEWEVRVTGTNYDSTYTVSTTPSLTVTGLYQGVTYSVIVRAFCAATVQSEWTEPVTLTPVSCERPTDVAVSVNGTSATVTWNGTADRYEVAYNYQGDGLTGATTQMVTGTSVTLTGLDAATAYEVVVRAYCGEVISLWSDAKTFTTGTSGIDGVEGSQVNLYPNPASTMVTLDGIEGEAQVTLVDMNGRVVYTQSLSHSATQSLKIDLTGMAKGAYFVRITGERTNAIRKLIVK